MQHDLSPPAAASPRRAACGQRSVAHVRFVHVCHVAMKAIACQLTPLQNCVLESLHQCIGGGVRRIFSWKFPWSFFVVGAVTKGKLDEAKMNHLVEIRPVSLVAGSAGTSRWKRCQLMINNADANMACSNVDVTLSASLCKLQGR